MSLESELQFNTEGDVAAPAEPAPIHIHSSALCRICLQPSTQPAYCKCSVDLMMHASCLLKQIVTEEDDNEQPYCQLCGEKFRIEFEAKRRLGCSGLLNKIRKKKGKCIWLSAVTVLLLAYLGIFGWLVQKQSISIVAVWAVMIGLAVFDIFAFLIVAGVWVYEFLLNRKKPLKLSPLPIKTKMKKGRNREEELMGDT